MTGVIRIGGCQGSLISNLLDVMVQACDALDKKGVHVEARRNVGCIDGLSRADFVGSMVTLSSKLSITLSSASQSPLRWIEPRSAGD